MRRRGADVLVETLRRYGAGEGRDATITREACTALRSVTLGDDRRKDFSGTLYNGACLSTALCCHSIYKRGSVSQRARSHPVKTRDVVSWPSTGEGTTVSQATALATVALVETIDLRKSWAFFVQEAKHLSSGWCLKPFRTKELAPCTIIRTNTKSFSSRCVSRVDQRAGHKNIQSPQANSRATPYTICPRFHQPCVIFLPGTYDNVKALVSAGVIPLLVEAARASEEDSATLSPVFLALKQLAANDESVKLVSHVLAAVGCCLVVIVVVGCRLSVVVAVVVADSDVGIRW